MRCIGGVDISFSLNPLSFHELHLLDAADPIPLWFSLPEHEYPPLLNRTTCLSNRIVDWNVQRIQELIRYGFYVFGENLNDQKIFRFWKNCSFQMHADFQSFRSPSYMRKWFWTLLAGEKFTENQLKSFLLLRTEYIIQIVIFDFKSVEIQPWKPSQVYE